MESTPAATEEVLKALETKYACQLPDDYRKFLLANNGGFPTPDCVTFTEAGKETATDVYCFLAVGEKRAWASLDWHLENFAARLPAKALPIARDSCGNLWLLSVAGSNSGSVYFWDHGTFANVDETNWSSWPRVATSFQEFTTKLKKFDGDAPDSFISRYAMVKQAVDNMAQRDAGFSSRSKPGFAWHCDCDDSGKVKLQYVQYEVHGIATHTDGYNRLQSIKGVIQAGQPRLPQ